MLGNSWVTSQLAAYQWLISTELFRQNSSISNWFRHLEGLDKGRFANDFISIRRKVREDEVDRTKYGRDNSDLKLKSRNGLVRPMLAAAAGDDDDDINCI
jgi:hypothetical protein